MKLLFDQNISFKIIEKLADNYPNCKQVREIGLENKPDLAIWQYAKNHNYTIVTFDSDFYEIANLKGHPPKIIWLRTGNTTTENIARVLTDKLLLITDFVNNEENTSIACLEIE